MKNKLYGIDVPLDIFDDNFLCCYGDMKKFGEYIGKELKPNTDGMVHMSDEMKIYIFIGKTPKDIGLIAHEVTHAVLNLSHKRGLWWSDVPSEQELMAYLMGYVVDYIWKTKQWYEWKGVKKGENIWKEVKK